MIYVSDYSERIGIVKEITFDFGLGGIGVIDIFRGEDDVEQAVDWEAAGLI